MIQRTSDNQRNLFSVNFSEELAESLKISSSSVAGNEESVSRSQHHGYQKDPLTPLSIVQGRGVIPKEREYGEYTRDETGLGRFQCRYGAL